MTNLRVLALAACLVAAPLLVSAQAIGTVENDLNYGREYLAAGNSSSASTWFRQAVMRHPDHAEANLLLAVALQRSGKPDEARPYYEKAVALDPSLSSRPEVRQLAAALGAPAPTKSLIPAAPSTKPVRAGGSVAREDAPIGSASYLLNYAQEHMRAGNFEGAKDYARQALAVEPNNAQALSILEDAQARRAPADASAAVRAPGGDPQQVGTPAYFLRHAKYHYDNGAYSAAVNYAKQALAVDPNFAEAKQMLAKASGREDTASADKGSCEARYSACWSGAMTYTPGSGYSPDNLRRQQCMVERNICMGGK